MAEINIEKLLQQAIHPESVVSTYCYQVINIIRNHQVTNNQKIQSLLFYLASHRGIYDVIEAADLSEEVLLKVEKMVGELESQLLPSLFMIFEHMKFFERVPQEKETLDDYKKALEILAENCDFGPEKIKLIHQQASKFYPNNNSKSKPTSDDLTKTIRTADLSDEDQNNSIKCVERLKATSKLLDKTEAGIKCDAHIGLKKKTFDKSRHAGKSLNYKRTSSARNSSLDIHNKCVKVRKIKHSKNSMHASKDKMNLADETVKSEFRSRKKHITGNNVINKGLVENVIKSQQLCVLQSENFKKQQNIVKTRQGKYKQHLSDSRKYICELCGKIFSIKSSLSRHINKHISIEPENSIGLTNGKKYNRTQFSCTVCYQQLDSRHKFKKHMNTHSRYCNYCNKVLDCESSFQIHMDGHIGRKPHQCPECSRCFTRKCDMKTHLLTHDPDRKKLHVCEVCGRDFYRIFELARHRKLHTGEKVFHCDICKKSFPTANGLKCHRILHSGVKSFTCEKCGKSFAQKSNLQLHLLRHSGIKEFACAICTSRFSRKCYLQSHMRSHTKEKPFKCDSCGACLASRFSLQRHTLTHTGVKPHVCVLCGSQFAWESTFKRHMENHTNLDVVDTIQSSDNDFINTAKRNQNQNNFKSLVFNQVGLESSGTGVSSPVLKGPLSKRTSLDNVDNLQVQSISSKPVYHHLLPFQCEEMQQQEMVLESNLEVPKFSLQPHSYITTQSRDINKSYQGVNDASYIHSNLFTLDQPWPQ